MTNAKAKIVTAALVAFMALLLQNIVRIFPDLLPWVLGVFAIPGAIAFTKSLYRWLTWEPPKKTYQDYVSGGYESP